LDKILEKTMLKGKLHLLYSAYVIWRKMADSRKMAKAIRKKIVARKGFSLVDRQLKKRIKDYCHINFGSSSYWPWLAVYTEIRGEYKEGWIPVEILSYKMLPGLNRRDLAWISMLKTYNTRLFGDKTVRPLLVVIDRQIYDENFSPVSKEQADEIMKNHDAEVIIKKDEGYGGDQIVFCRSAEVRLEDYIGKLNCVIQPVVRQHDALDKIYSGSVNTIRVLTYLDAGSGVTVKFIRLKAGTNGARINNMQHGGRGVYLDHEGRAISGGYNEKLFEYEDTHPDTGFLYKDIYIPGIKEAVELCREAHLLYPYVAIIGWDIYIDQQEKPYIIEWNAPYPSLWIHEALIGPMFEMNELLKRVAF
jgi:hypothetical protein